MILFTDALIDQLRMACARVCLHVAPEVSE